MFLEIPELNGYFNNFCPNSQFKLITKQTKMDDFGLLKLETTLNNQGFKKLARNAYTLRSVCLFDTQPFDISEKWKQRSGAKLEKTIFLNYFESIVGSLRNLIHLDISVLSNDIELPPFLEVLYIKKLITTESPAPSDINSLRENVSIFEPPKSLRVITVIESSHKFKVILSSNIEVIKIYDKDVYIEPRVLQYPRLTELRAQFLSEPIMGTEILDIPSKCLKVCKFYQDADCPIKQFRWNSMVINHKNKWVTHNMYSSH